jgi:hypothetical protein
MRPAYYWTLGRWDADAPAEPRADYMGRSGSKVDKGWHPYGPVGVF